MPWQDDVMIEQDLLISRSIITLFSDEFLAEKLAIRGGTALPSITYSPNQAWAMVKELIERNMG